MKKDGRKARKIQREKLNRAKAVKPTSIDSKAKRRIHKCYHHKIGIAEYNSWWSRVLGNSENSKLDPIDVVARMFDPTKDSTDEWTCLDIITEQLFRNEYYGTAASFLEQISDTTCRCSVCKKEFPLELMKTIDKIVELQSGRYKQYSLGGKRWKDYENVTAAKKIAELEETIPIVKYRRLSAQEFLYVD
ncbi:MAG: hypothetical protein IJ374_07200 [Lachnospiraceae bacterium]|nr:hypothetical protein [Lachnospiraceae bacterium]